MTPAVIVAMDSELKALKSIGVKAVCSGIGKINAASAATRLSHCCRVLEQWPEEKD